MKLMKLLGLTCALAILAPQCAAWAQGTDGDGAESSSRRPARKRSKSQVARDAAAAQDDGMRRVWSETPGARVKSVYDEQGNLVYQKAWDKESGQEVAPGDTAARDGGSDRETSTASALRRRNAAEGSRSFQDDRDQDRGREYEDSEPDPHPKFEEKPRSNNPPRPVRHPYEFALGLTFWNQALTGTIAGAGGVEAELAKSSRSTMQAEFHNAKVGYSYTRILHTTPVTSSVTFDGKTFAASSTYDQRIQLLDGFYRWGIYTGEDSWMDFLIGAKVMDISAKVSDAATTGAFDQIVPLPELGLIGQHSLLDNLRLRGFLKGAYGALSENTATVWDAEFEAAWTFGSDHEYSYLNQFCLGYKYLMMTLETNVDAATAASADLTMQGPYVKFMAHF